MNVATKAIAEPSAMKAGARFMGNRACWLWESNRHRTAAAAGRMNGSRRRAAAPERRPNLAKRSRSRRTKRLNTAAIHEAVTAMERADDAMLASPARCSRPRRFSPASAVRRWRLSYWSIQSAPGSSRACFVAYASYGWPSAWRRVTSSTLMRWTNAAVPKAARQRGLAQSPSPRPIPTTESSPPR